MSYQAISSSLVENLTVFFPTREVNLTGLIKNIMYSVRVLASTDKGNGNYSDPELFATNQDGKLVFRFSSNNPSKKSVKKGTTLMF